MNRTYTISHKIPRGITNFTPQGLRDIFETSNVSKRSRKYEVQIETVSPQTPADFESNLDAGIIKALKEFFNTPFTQWVTENYYVLTRIRSLFLYDRDNDALWCQIQETFMEWVSGLSKETQNIELGLVLPTVECVHLNMRHKIERLYDYLYWFNPTVRKLYGAKNVLNHLTDLYAQNYIYQDTIMQRIKQSLLSLHHQYYNGESPAVFAEYFEFMRGVCRDDDRFLNDLLELIASTSLQLLAGTDVELLMDRCLEWRAKELHFWSQVFTKEGSQADLDLLFKKLEVFVFEQILVEYRDDFTPLLLENPQLFQQFTKMIMQVGVELGHKFREICKEIVRGFYHTINALEASPLVTATMLCDFAEITLTGPVGETLIFSSCWLDFIYDDSHLGKILALKAAHSMQQQNFSYVSIISGILKLDTSIMDEELSPFLKSFGENLWKYTCELGLSQPGENKANRFVHGMNILKASASEVVWHAAQFTRLLETQAVFNQVYWSREVKYPFETSETKELTIAYQQTHPNRIVQWDLGHTFAEVQLNSRRIECSYAAFQVLEALLSAPGYSLCIGDLKIPEKLQDAALKELIAHQNVFYVPSSRDKKFNNDDTIYLTYN